MHESGRTRIGNLVVTYFADAAVLVGVFGFLDAIQAITAVRCIAVLGTSGVLLLVAIGIELYRTTPEDVS
jgi:hypothetical protein